ncbi:unnamed protein product, partial [Gongylonema pulchrum]|uniref:E3 ubiquitin-protein ligase n=1 Tax=Gongylonema pulchrum TaxID=637853 RepID=A0A183DUF8_9BILA
MKRSHSEMDSKKKAEAEEGVSPKEQDPGTSVSAEKTNEKQLDSPQKSDECVICYQPYTFKTELPDCGHTFCFLCIKGVALRNQPCPLCRRRISRSLFNDPKLTTEQPTDVAETGTSATENVQIEKKSAKVHWYYEVGNHFCSHRTPRFSRAIKRVEDVDPELADAIRGVAGLRTSNTSAPSLAASNIGRERRTAT